MKNQLEKTEPMGAPIFAGYFPRRIAMPTGPRIPPQVVLLGNAGHCDGLRPEYWERTWRHNELGLFDNLELAWGIVPPAERTAYRLFGYSFLPLLVVNGVQQQLDLPALSPDPLPADWVRLGFDPVTFSGLVPVQQNELKCFGHSPLSPFCNGRCGDIPVNPYCLLETVTDGLARVREFSNGGGEPEPYVLVEVWMQPTSPAS